MIANKLCPYCMSLQNIKRIEEPEVITVRGQDIIVDSRWLECQACKNTFDDPLDDFDVLKEAYQIYNKLNPDNPVKIRK